MSVRNLSSTVRIKASEISPEVRRRYGLFDEDEVTAELDQLQTAGAWKQDQRLKNDITSALHRLELDNVKPGFDVLAQTGFRRGYQVRKRSPGEALIASLSATDRGRNPSRRHSYIEPRVVRQQLEKIEHVPIHVERSVRFTEPEPVRRYPEPASSSVWYYTEPRSYSFLQSPAPSFRRTVAQPEENRALAEYTDTLAAAPRRQHQQQRWSVYGLAPAADWRRSQSTPPDLYRLSTAVRPVGDRLTRRRNHEFAIGVKLAESQTELDTFNRMLDKRFGGSVGTDRSNPWRRTSSVYPSYWPNTYYTSPLYYDYKTPRYTTYYSSDLYGPPTRVAKTSETLAHGSPYYGYSDYVPYSKYVPYRYSDYGTTWLRGYEPWYASYPRSGHYVERSRYLF